MKNIINKNIVIAGGLIVCLLLSACNKKEPETAVEEKVMSSHNFVEITPEQRKSIGIEMGHFEKREISGAVIVSGLLDVPPQNLVNITAPFGGFLRSTSLLQGMKVTKGQSIAIIENPEYVQLQQDYLDTKGQLEFLSAELRRQEELAKENVNSTKVLQKSTADLASMEAKYNGLRVKLKMLNINVDNLKPESIKSTIELYSPINGYVTHVNIGVGSFVNPVEVLFQIVDTQHLHAELTAFERDLPKIKIGQRIRFMLSNETTERIATVYLIGREISEDRTVRIHGHIEKEDKELIPGMFLKAFIETNAKGNAVSSLPESAVINYEDKNFIFIKAVNDNSFNLVEVGTGIRENGFVEVSLPSSVSAENVSVVVKGGYKLLSKMKIEEAGDDSEH